MIKKMMGIVDTGQDPLQEEPRPPEVDIKSEKERGPGMYYMYVLYVLGTHFRRGQFSCASGGTFLVGK